MAKRKLKDLPRSSSRTKTVGQDPLKKPLRGLSLNQTHPALAFEYIDKGPYSADDVSAGSNRIVEWKHGTCGNKIKVAIGTRARAWDEGSADQGCYICAGRNPEPKEPSVIPSWLCEEIIADVRLKPAKDLSPWTQSYRLFRCPKGTGYIYSSRVIDRINPFTLDARRGCPCDECYTDERVNLVVITRNRKPYPPNYWTMFIRTSKNVGFDPQRLPVDHRVCWRCEKSGHLFARSWTELFQDGCPRCVKDACGLLTAYRSVAREFLFVPSNPALAAKNLLAGSHIVATFRCSSGHTFNKAIYRRTQQNPENCPTCAGKRSDAERLFTVSPYLLKRWDFEKNVVTDIQDGETETIDPDSILADSRRKYWFFCHSKHSYRASAVELLEGSDNCTGCNLLPNCVDNARPEITSQWDSSKNGDRTPWNTSATTSTKVWWKCARGPDHEWEAEVCQRAIKGTDCPYCANRKLSLTNSLLAVHPALAKQLHDEANGKITAADIIVSSKEKLWWLCACNNLVSCS